MKAISVKQVWAWAILNAGKDIENRDWATSFRGTVAIHASKGLTKSEYEFSRYMVLEFAEHLEEDEIPTFEEIEKGAILGTVEIVDCVTKSDSLWFFGKYGFVLKNPRRLTTPIPCKGALSFWDVPKEVEGQMIFEPQEKQ